MAAGVRFITPGERVEGAPTPGMTREEAIVTDRIWAGLVRTEPGTISAWHHHGDYETAVYILEGGLRMEWGPGGSEAGEGRAGDFLFVPPHTVHREITPEHQAAQAIVVRSGTGTPVFNVDGPEPGP
ncbi:MAG TPA: cupin domain-containing protein [candidate division Zixibacteria bacterium]|nr:cupin domain-containing protein [candidate division Zixibacteria bacterium]